MTTDAADRELKANHRTMWALGDYPSVADEVIAPLRPVLVEATGIGSGDRVLDVAAGSGNASVPAVEAGGDRVPITWQEADAEALPFDDASFDGVISCVGAMFAPHHATTAAELLRVCRPGGRIGLVSWTPEGFIGQMFATMKPYAPPPLLVPSHRHCGARSST